MKKFAKLFLAVAALFAGFACTTDTTEDLGVNPVGQTTLTLSLEESRTQLGEKADGLYPLVWSEGDQIAVNGVASTALTAEQAGTSGALFTFESTLTRPYSIVYPAPAEGVVALTEGQYPVTFPAVQEYVAGSFCAGAAPMYGYAAADTEGAIQMNHLTGILRLAVKGEGVVLKSLTITTESGAIAGTYDVDCATGTLTAHDDASNTVEVSFEGGLALGAEATPIYVAVPAGTYGKFTLLLTSTTDIMRLSFDSTAKPIAAGTVREFAEFAYEANADESEVFIIDSKEALIQFAQIAANFAPYTTAKVTAPIDMTDYEWKAIEGFGAYIFDGGEFEIKGLTAPLFGTTAATIKNVKLTGVNIVETETPNVGAIARSIKANGTTVAQLLNCSAEGSIVVNCPNYEKVNDTDTEFSVGGLVGHSLNLDVADCVNEVTIEVKQSLKSTCEYSVYPCVGGIVGYAYADSPESEINFVDCENKANLTLAEVSDVEAASDVSKIYITPRLGGCVGNLYATYTSMQRCINRGALVIDKWVRNAYLGGVAGNCGTPATDNCENYGTVTFKGVTNSIYMGGVVGHTGGETHIDTCHNYGAISTTAESSISAIVCGGVVANNTSEATTTDNRYVSNCSNSGAITIAHTQAADANAGRFMVGGIVGWSQGVCDNNTNEGAITVNSTFYANSASANNHCIGGIVGYKTVKQVTNSFSKGAIVVNGKMTANADIKSTGTAILNIGGIIGYSTQSLYSGSNDGCSITVTGDYEALLHVGGFCGRATATSDLTNKAPINITSTAKMNGLLMGGIGGLCEGKATNGTNDASMTYNGDCNMTGIGDGTNTNGCTYFSIGGLIGRGTSSCTNLTNTANGVLTVGGKFTASITKKYGWTSIGGVAGTLSSGAHSKLYNWAAMNVVLNVPNASWNEEPFTFGGVVGYVTNNASEIHNYGDLTFSGTVKSDEPTRISGVYGRGSNTGTNTYTNISNSGNITVSVVSSDNIYVSGINSYNTKSTYNNLVNKGNITITSTAKSNANLYVGGVFAAPGNAITTTGTVANTGKITVNGTGTTLYIAGCATTHASAAAVHYVNTGDIEVNKPEGATYTSYIGGIAATTTVNLVDAQVYCSLVAIGCENVGMITGSARSETALVTNCKIGGNIAFETKTSEDTDGNETVAPDWIKIDNTNFFTYIYGGATDWTGVENYDGCSVLTTAPEI